MNIITSLSNTFNITPIILETLLGMGLAFATSNEDTRMMNTVVAGGLGLFFYYNSAMDKQKDNVLNYHIQ